MIDQQVLDLSEYREEVMNTKTVPEPEATLMGAEEAWDDAQQFAELLQKKRCPDRAGHPSECPVFILCVGIGYPQPE